MASSAIQTPSASQVRSLYRRLLRELPSRKPSILSNPSPIQRTIRSTFVSVTSSTPSPSSAEDKGSKTTSLNAQRHAAATDQFIQYLAAQRQYTTLVERYNPGMNLEEEERVRLTARRVGMNLPEEFRALLNGTSCGSSGNGGDSNSGSGAKGHGG